MISLTDAQYAAIGRVAVQSGTLERELGEYIVRLNVPKFNPGLPLSLRLNFLHAYLSGFAPVRAGLPDFDFVISRLHALIQQRNAVAHGTWNDVSNAPTTLGEVTVTGKRAVLHAKDIERVAKQFSVARKLLLRLFHDHYHVAAGHKNCPKKTSAALKLDL